MITLTGKTLTVDDIALLRAGGAVRLSPAALRRTERSRRMLERESSRRRIYGVNTGFGPMASHAVAGADAARLQANLVRGHAAGMGAPVAEELVRAAMVVRLNTLLRGDSGVSAALLKSLQALINAGITPVVPERGGVGASGDLVQLSHIALGLIGEGDVFLKGKRMTARAALKRAGLVPYTLKQKEGLSLINGTSFMAGAACLVIADAERLFSAAVRSSAFALEAAHGLTDALDAFLHAARPHPGQARVAAAMRRLAAGSRLVRSRKQVETGAPDGEGHVQDVYSIRCAPQILGPVLDTLAQARRVATVEINATTDNPLVHTARKSFPHGGNFHGDYVAVEMDKLKASLAKLSVLLERRINYFMNHSVNRRFPPFLNLRTPGLDMGLQGLQFVATSTAALAQSLAYPHAVHSIPTNADNQDVVSMGADAAALARLALTQAEIILVIELFALSQAVACDESERALSKEARTLLRFVRSCAPPVTADRTLSADLETLRRRLRGARSLDISKLF